MGDEVIYFVQGHQQYVDAVKTNNVYSIDVDRNQPWHKMPHIRVCHHYFYDDCSILIPVIIIVVIIYTFLSRLEVVSDM